MRLEIFDVEAGACALLTADNGTRLMIDCGQNTSTGWRPGTYLLQQGTSTLEMLAITNYDEDHARGAPNLFDKVDVQWLWRNRSVSRNVVTSLKSEDGMGPGIERLAYVMETVFTGGTDTGGQVSPEPVFQGLEQRSCFYSRYPQFDDENNLSMAVFLKCHGIGIMFTGDLERPGFDALLVDPQFRQALASTHVYVASHHGRENGCSENVAALLTDTFYVVISDKGYMYDTQETLPFYRRIAKGGPFRGDKRHVLTTRRDGHIRFQLEPGSWGPY